MFLKVAPTVCITSECIFLFILFSYRICTCSQNIKFFVNVFCVQDLLYVISYGPSQVKPPAVQMLFHYWPNLKPPGAISEYRGLQYTGKIL